MATMLLCGCREEGYPEFPDLMVRDHPEVVRRIHEEYLEAGADIIVTDSFNSNPLSLACCGLEGEAYALSRKAARLARAVADKYTRITPDRPRFVAGSVGPVKTMLPVAEEHTLPFGRLVGAYEVQMKGLIDGGVDIILIETVIDTLCAKAGLCAISRLERQSGCKIPVIMSATVDANGRLLSGERLETFFPSVGHAGLLAAGINCCSGSSAIMPLAKRLSKAVDFAVALYPNAGLPDDCGRYLENPSVFASNLKECMEAGLVNVVGGCCGTTPAHIRQLNEAASRFSPRQLPRNR